MKISSTITQPVTANNDAMSSKGFIDDTIQNNIKTFKQFSRLVAKKN